MTTELQFERAVLGRWEQGHTTKEEFRNIAQAHSDCVQKAKAELELKVERDIKGNKASFCYCMSSKRINVDLLPNRTGDSVNRTGDSVTVDTDKESSDTLRSPQSLLSLSFHQGLSDVLIDKLTASQQCALEAEGEQYLGCINRRIVTGQVKQLFPLLGTY